MNRALIEAARSGDAEEVRALLERGVDPAATDESGATALVAAAYGNHLEAAEVLIKAGADVNSHDSYNGTGLIRAADRGHVEIIRELLETDVEIDHVNRLGWTALLEAIILGDGGLRHTEVVRLLIEAGANVNLADGEGVSPLEHAKRKGHGEIARLLRDAGRGRRAVGGRPALSSPA
ncbi:MAG: ankyrin repeat domain-containing protein [Chloroflexia bacterium]